MKSILCCAILILPAAHGASPKISGKLAAVPPKARVVFVQPKKTKVLVSTSASSVAAREKAALAEKNTVPRVVAARPVASNDWRWIPKFQKTGKEDTTWGFLLKRPF